MRNFAFVSMMILSIGSVVFAQKPAPAKPKPTPAAAATSAAADEKAVRAAFETLLEGIRKSDVEAVTGVYWNSPQTVFFNNNGSTTLGWEQDRKNREARYPKTSNVKIDVRNVSVLMLGRDGAVVSCLWKQTQEYEANPESASGRMTLVFRRIGKDWKIVHLHTSPDNPPATRPVFPSERERVN